MLTQYPVCVTGATGFIASHIITELLQKGYQVKGTVRNIKAKDKYHFLTVLENAEQNLTLCQAELFDLQSLEEAVQGCEYIIHCASPYVVNVDDPMSELVNPAVQGTLNILEACKKKRIKRLVLTSSVAAITDGPVKHKIFTEQDWNEKSSLTRNPYYYSKTLAEKKAWDFLQQETAFELITINPFMVIGPSLTPVLNTSNKVLSDVMQGVYPVIMDLCWGFVDVRDVAIAHRLALETKNATGRYLCANRSLHLRALISSLKAAGQTQYPYPKISMDHKIGSLLLKLISYTQEKGTGSYLRSNLGGCIQFDNSKIKRDLGLTFRDLDETIMETIADLRHWQHLKH